MRFRPTRHLPALVAAAAAVLITAGCGSGGDGGSDSGGPADGSGQNAFSAYVECMKKNGVALTVPTGRPGGMPSGRPSARPSGSAFPRPSGSAFPRPSGSAWARPSGAPDGGRQGGMFGKPDGVDDAVWNKAVQACQSVRPTFGPGGRDGRDGEDNGGTGNNDGNGGNGNGSLTAYQNCLKDHGVASPAQPAASDPKLASAVTACEVLSPAP